MNDKIKICINGQSATGKDTIKKHLIDLGLKYGVSATTRKPRQGEDESYYRFKKIEEFFQDLREDKMIEYDYFAGNFYGYEKNQMSADFFIVAGQGMLELKKYFLDHGYKVIIVGLTLDRKIQRQRMLDRGDSLASINLRLNQTNKERFENDLKHADVIFENANSKETANKIMELLYDGLNGGFGMQGEMRGNLRGEMRRNDGYPPVRNALQYAMSGCDVKNDNE